MEYTIIEYHMPNQNKSKKVKKQHKSHLPFNKQDKKHIKFNKSKLRTELEAELYKKGLEFRPDSGLCAKYINGDTDLSLDYVVQRMCEMKYLYEYCDMKSIRAQVYNDYVNSGYVKDYEGTITTQAEKIALQTYSNGTYPLTFPWEKNKIDDLDDLNNLDDFDCQCRYQYILFVFSGIFVSILLGIFIVFVKNVTH